MYLDKEAEVEFPFQPDRKPKHLEIVAGDKALEEGVGESHREFELRRMARILNVHSILSFPAILKAVAERKKWLAESVEPLWLKYASHVKRVSTVENAGKKGAGGICVDGGLTVCENSDDAFWISLGDREAAKECLFPKREVSIQSGGYGQ